MRCVRPACATRAVAWAAQWAVERQLQLTSAHRETAVELEESGVESILGHVPLHGALGVSRGADCSSTALKHSVNNHAPRPNEKEMRGVGFQVGAIVRV
jgi:hypothetical protein